MAEAKKSEKADKAQKQEKQQPEKEKKKFQIEENTEVLVRIYGYDIPGSRPIYAGFTRIKGISWAISNLLCLKMGYPRGKKIQELSKPEIAKIEAFLDTLDAPAFMKNRRFDREMGTTEHLYGADLDMKRDFDIKRLKEIRSYKGVRHALKLPVRGQRTRSHFRTHKAHATGKKAKAPEAKK